MTLHISEYEKEQQEKIQKELSKYSYSQFAEFNNLFPCRGLLKMTVWFPDLSKTGYFVYMTDNENIITKPCRNVPITYYYDSSQKFWRTWNKYKNLKAFL